MANSSGMGWVVMRFLLLDEIPSGWATAALAVTVTVTVAVGMGPQLCGGWKAGGWAALLPQPPGNRGVHGPEWTEALKQRSDPRTLAPVAPGDAARYEAGTYQVEYDCRRLKSRHNTGKKKNQGKSRKRKETRDN